MAQQRFFNWKENDSTFLLAQRLAGYFLPGRYAGFDFSPTANMTLTLPHTVSGMDVRGYTGSPVKNGVVHTNQGVTVFEDAAVTLPIGAVGGLPRIDLVVLTHSQTQNPGGALALYSVVQGTPGASPVKPAIPTPDTQLEIGSLYLPASVTALNQPGVIWVQSKVSALETKASNVNITELYTLSNYIIDALGKVLAFQTYNAPDSYPALPPMLIYGGVDEQDTPLVNPGYIYFEGELLRILQENSPSGAGSLIVWDRLGTAPFRTAKPRRSNIADGDFLNTDLRLFYDIIQQKTIGTWTNFNLTSGWQTGVLLGAGYYPAQYKIQSGQIYLRGALVWEGASQPTNNVFASGNLGLDVGFHPTFITADSMQPIHGSISGAALKVVLPFVDFYVEAFIDPPGIDHVFFLDGCVLSYSI